MAAANVPKALHAAEHYIKAGAGASAKLPVLSNVLVSLGLGISLGLVWKTYHWNTKRKIVQYYHDLAQKEMEEEKAWKDSVEEKLRQIIANLDS